jgi:hypothetical protein
VQKKYTPEDEWRALRHIYESSDPVVIVVRGHIIVENFLDASLDRYLQGGIGVFCGAGFSTKFRLAYAVGLLNESERDLFAAFNTLRNRLAHRLDAHASDEDERGIKSAFGKAGFADDLGTGAQVYHVFVTVLYCILAARGADIGTRHAPIVASACDEDYWKRMRQTVLVPFGIAEQDGSLSALAIALALFGFVVSLSRQIQETPAASSPTPWPTLPKA